MNFGLTDEELNQKTREEIALYGEMITSTVRRDITLHLDFTNSSGGVTRVDIEHCEIPGLTCPTKNGVPVAISPPYRDGHHRWAERDPGCVRGPGVLGTGMWSGPDCSDGDTPASLADATRPRLPFVPIWHVLWPFAYTKP